MNPLYLEDKAKPKIMKEHSSNKNQNVMFLSKDITFKKPLFDFRKIAIVNFISTIFSLNTSGDILIK